MSTSAPIKVVIVDDEVLVRNLLRNCIDWTELNLSIAGEAANANEALELVERESPDIIFTDIYMPIINGITFSEMVLKKYPHMKIVVLTGYDDFEYAQRGIRAGISEYLLKPINDEEVMRTAIQLKRVIEQERKNDQDNSELRKRLYDNLPYLKEKFLSELVENEFNSGMALERMEFLGIYFKYASYQVAVIEIEKRADEEGGSEGESDAPSAASLLAIVNRSLVHRRFTVAFHDTGNRVVVLNNDEELDLYEICERWKEQIRDETTYAICIGLGNIKRELGDVGASYREALEAITYRIVFGNNVIIQYDHIDLYHKTSATAANNLYNKLGFALKAGLNDRVAEIIDEIYVSMDPKDKAVLATIRKTAMNIHMICLRKLREQELEPHAEAFEEDFARYFELETIPDIKRRLLELTERTIGMLNRHRIRKSDDSGEDMKKYIDENYADSALSLSNLAKVFFLNPSYISRTFKKEFGVNFVEYLTKVRIEKAIDLFKEQDAKALEIAREVGFTDSNYFSTCFKKYTGVSVSDYKKKLRQGN